MKNFETYRNQEELLARIEQLRASGVKDNEIEVISSKKIDGYDYLDYSDINQKTNEVTLGDRIAAFFTGEDPEDKAFERYDFDDNTRLEAVNAVRSGNYVLYINRDDYYDDPNYYENRSEYLDEDIRSREDLSNEDKIRIHEERLRVNKDRVQTGQVDINKEVVTEHQEIEVPVEREKVTVERRKVDERAAGDFDSSIMDDGETIRVPIHEEKLSVDKENVVTEEVVIKKDVVQDTETVSGDVRKEKIDIDEDVNSIDKDIGRI